MKHLFKFYIILAVFLLSSCEQFLDPRAFIANERAKRSIQNQNFSDAQEFLVQALRFAPFQSEVHLNLGLLHELSKDKEKAQKSYSNAQKYATNPATLFYSYYDEAQLLGQDQKVDQALEFYQKALEIYPISKEIKHNIELLIQMQQQQQNGQGQGNDQKKQDKNQSKNQQQNKDQKKDPNDNEGKDQEKSKEYAETPKYKPRPFKGEELSEGDVKKILGELKQQEQKIRSKFNNKQMKERPRDKDW